MGWRGLKPWEPAPGSLASGLTGAWEWPAKRGGGCCVRCQADPRIHARQSLTGRKGATGGGRPGLAPVSSPEGLESQTDPRSAGAGPAHHPCLSTPWLPLQRGRHGILQGICDSCGSGQRPCPQASRKSQVMPSLHGPGPNPGRLFLPPRGIPISPGGIPEPPEPEDGRPHPA